MSRIKKIIHPHAWELHQARLDESIITGQPLIERPFHYENKETVQLYYDLYGCIGWPSEVSDRDEGMPGYAAVVGIVKPKTGGARPQDAVFQLLAESESKDVPTLINRWLDMRAEYGFGIHPGLLQTLFGDPDRFITVLALRNEKLIADGGDRAAILVSPPDDFYSPMVFDNYVRALRSCLQQGSARFYFGHNEILKAKLREFRKDDPAVMAIGGLCHSLLSRCEWMDQARENMFVLEEGEDNGW